MRDFGTDEKVICTAAGRRRARTIGRWPGKTSRGNKVKNRVSDENPRIRGLTDQL